VFLKVEKALDITWYSGQLNKLTELEFSTSLIKITARVLATDKLPTSKAIATRVPQASVITPVCTCICGTEEYVRYVVRKLQRSLSAAETWCVSERKDR
jgi:hypothetical protein